MSGRQGIDSKNLTHRPVKTGVGARAVNPVYVSRVGQSLGNKITGKREVAPYKRAEVYGGASFKPVPLGNSLTNNIGCAGGPGKGRTNYGQSGLQGQHGRVNPGVSRPSTKGQWPD